MVAILKMATARNFSMSGINSGHHNLPTYEMSLKSDNAEFVQYCDGHFEKISSGRHFQNGHHNTAQIQHCLISTTFHMWVDYDVSNLFPTLINSGHHNLPTYQILMISDNVEFLRYCGSHFENGDR
jgi:hypothetical protein